MSLTQALIQDSNRKAPPLVACSSAFRGSLRVEAPREVIVGRRLALHVASSPAFIGRMGGEGVSVTNPRGPENRRPSRNRRPTCGGDTTRA